jgi:YceI-like protein
MLPRMQAVAVAEPTPAACASPGGHRIPAMRGYLPALDHGVMDRHPPRRGPVMPDTAAAAAVQIPAAGIYKLDPDTSTVTFATRHMFGLAPVKGTFRLVSGQITIADPVTSSTVSAPGG